MEIKVLEKEKTRLKLEFVGKTHTMCNLLANELWNDKDIAVAGYNLDHPVVSNAVLILETTKGDATKALLDAIVRVEKENKEFLSSIKK